MSVLHNRNVFVNGRRTSMRLELEMWDALEEIGAREKLTIHELCSRVDAARGESSLTGAIRIFIITYYRTASQASTAPLGICHACGNLMAAQMMSRTTPAE